MYFVIKYGIFFCWCNIRNVQYLCISQIFVIYYIIPIIEKVKWLHYCNVICIENYVKICKNYFNSSFR